MSELRKLFTARFASNRPPPGESRLLGFANDPTAPQGPEEGPTLEKREKADVQDIVGESQGKIEASLPGVMIPGFTEACESPEWMQEILDRPGTAKDKLLEILKSKGYENADLSTLEPEMLSPDVRRTLVAEMLRENPELLVHLAESVDRRIEQHAELMASIERKIKGALEKKFNISAKHLKILSGESVAQLGNLEQLLGTVTNDNISRVIHRLQSQGSGELSEGEIASMLELPLAANETETKAQRALIRFMIELKGTVHRKNKYGSWLWFGKKPESDAVYDQNQESYRANLKKEQQALREYIDVELKRKAAKIIEEHTKTRDEILAKIKQPDEILPPSVADVRMLQAEGYDYEAFVQAATRHIDPVYELGLMDIGYEPKRYPSHHPRFVAHAKEAFNVLQERSTNGAMEFKKLLQEKKQEQSELNEWAYKTAKKLRRLHQLPDGARKNKIVAFLRKSGMDWSDITEMHDFFDPYAFLKDDPAECERQLKASPEKRLFVTDPEWDWDARHDTEIGENVLRSRAKPINKRQLLTAIFTLMERDPELLVLAQDDLTDLDKQSKELGPDTEVASQILQTRADLSAVLGEIRATEHADHTLWKTVNVSKLLEEKQRAISRMLYVDDSGKPIINEQVRSQLPLAIRQVQALQQSNERLKSIRQNIVREPMEPDSLGYIDNGVIHINSNKDENAQKIGQNHEEGHAILWALQSSFPLMLIRAYDRLKDQPSPDTRETFEDILYGLREYNSYRDITARMDLYSDQAKEKYDDSRDIRDETHRIFMSHMLDELLVRHADWRLSKQKEPNKPKQEREQILFRMLDEHRPQMTKAMAELAGVAAEGPRKYMREDDMDLGGLSADEAVETASSGGSASEKLNVHQALKDIRRDIEMMEAFRDAYAPQSPEMANTMNGHIQRAEEEYKALFKRFLQMRGDDEDPVFEKQVIELKKRTTALKKKIQDVDVEQLDISGVGKEKGPGFFDNIQFLSILDIVKLWNDTKEDLVTTYKRRQDRVLKGVGASVTEALGMGKHIPYWGEYFEGLRGYHERRYSGTDQEAAKKWQDSMALIDSHEVLHLIGTTRNRDLVRGGISLLVERGEMDWNDRGVWKTFQEMSGYKMPEEACMRDDLLRDTWLRKMVNEIWHDKEQYYHWKQGNDSHIKSHKDEFKPTADNLANVEGGLANELRKQLKQFVEWKENPKHPPVPDDVKPHLYEEVLHYAMRNGKMRMEDKIFYLVQGVRHGMLSIDRLRVLAGEGGEILLKFPFIDYFYQKNNTMSEITRLGKRLEEGEGKDKFKAGAKTMLFLQFELAREESYQHRLSKALGRDNMEKIDHEDWPMIVGSVDYNKIREMTGLLSGDRFKITTESGKNCYVGFNTRFKAMARLAEMEESGKARFTKNDARDMAISVTSFIQFDNLMTRKGWDGQKRLSLTWNDFNNTTGPSTGGMMLSVFRNSALSFSHSLLDALDAQNAFNWQAVLPSDNSLTKAELFSQMGEEFQSDAKATNKQTAAFDAMPRLQRELERALQERPDILKAVLKTHGDRKRTPKNYIMEEGADPDNEYLTTEETGKYFEGLAQEERIMESAHH